MVINQVDKIRVGAFGVFASSTHSISLLRLFPDLSWRVVVVDWPNRCGIVWYNVSRMHNTPLVLKHRVRKSSISVVSDTRRSKVNHVVNCDTVLQQGHCCKLGHCSSETVTGSLDQSSLVHTFKTIDLSNDLCTNRVCSFLKASVYLTFTFRPHLVVSLKRVKISDPILDGNWAAEHDVDGLVWGEITNKSFNVFCRIVNS